MSVGMDSDISRARNGVAGNMVEYNALKDVEGIDLDARIAVEMGRRTSELNNRLEGLSTLTLTLTPTLTLTLILLSKAWRPSRIILVPVCPLPPPSASRTRFRTVSKRSKAREILSR